MQIQPLPFDKRFQSGLLYLMLNDCDFLRSMVDDLSFKHFDAGEAHIKLYKLIVKVWEKTKRPVTVAIIRNSIKQLEVSKFYTEGDAFAMSGIIDAGATLIPSELDYIRENSIEFIRKQTIALAFSQSLDHFEKNDYDSMMDIMGKSFKKTYGIGNSLGLDYMEQSIDDRYSQPPRLDTWSTGFPTLDKYLGNAGFARKEAVTILASTGRGKCHSADTPILMSDGSIKMVQDIIVGDKLMGPDGKSRNVLSTTSGKDDLYKITPVKGMSYTVNSVHLLSLKATGNTHNLILSDGTIIKPKQEDPIFIQAKDFYTSNKTIKHCLKGWRPDAVSFESESTNHIIPPYILGVWLGDGTSNRPGITQLDNEVLSEFKKYAESINKQVVGYFGTNDKCPQWYIYGTSSFRTGLKTLGVWNNKHIPNSYKMSSINDRLELLAGLLDTDGSLHYSGYDFVQKDKQLAEDVVFIARSLGLAANISECTKTIKSSGFSGQYWRVTISGDCDKIPVRIGYKKAKPRLQKKNVLRTGVSIEKAGYGDYYGFEIDGDKQFLLGDWQVTHNTSLLCNLAISALKQKKKVIFYTLEMSELQIGQRMDAILSGCSIQEIATYGESRLHLKNMLSQLGPELHPKIKAFDRGRLSLSGLQNNLDKYCMDFGHPDVVFVDWIGCMKLSAGIDKKHEALAEVADGIVNMSREYNSTFITAHQTNRSAVGNDLFGYDSISESFSSLFGFDIAMGLGASDKAKDAGKRTLSLLKNRCGPDSVYVNLMGDKPEDELTYRFKEVPKEEESELLKPIENKEKKYV